MITISEKYQQILKSVEKYCAIDEKVFLESQYEKPNVSVKINPNKIKEISILEFELSRPVLWDENAYYLSFRPSFYADPLFYAGAYYVMDSASMFLSYLLGNIKLSKDAVILDIAAAPGGKSVLISNYLNEQGLLLSNEINLNRAKILVYNLSKWGKSNYVVTNNDSAAYSNLYEMFDLVVCDAPCSGSGLFRKYPEWINSFNEALVQQCVVRQKQILQNIFSSIKKDGFLIYSTCSFMSEENEEIAKFILDNGFQYIDINIPDNYGVIKTKYGMRFFPHLTDAEGFFYAVFQKQTSDISTPFKKHKLSHLPEKAGKPCNSPFFHFLKTNLFQQHDQQIYKYRNVYYLSNSTFTAFLPYPLKYLSIGTKIGENAYTPSAELALSIYLAESIPRIELTKKEAQKYLKKEALIIKKEKDIYLMCYQQIGLGWAKILENRCNNYFPNEWRILRDIPEC